MSTRDLSWWRSDEAISARSGLYLAAMLFNNKHHQRQTFSKIGPKWPAIFYYNIENDTPYWVEIKNDVHARDFSRGCHIEHMNEAARKLAA